jgi:hypothetical protein
MFSPDATKSSLSSIEDITAEHADKVESAQDRLAETEIPARRTRFGDKFSAVNGSVRTGSIALSFAVVSRR